MGLAKKDIFDATKPVDPIETARAGVEAENISKQIQRHYGKAGKPIVGSTAFQQGVASDAARQAEFNRQKEFIPKAYETAKGIEERQTQTQDELAGFWDEYGLRADELAMKQSQAQRETDLYSKLQNQETENKLREIEFSALKSDAERQDALEKAYLDGQADIQLQKAAINGQVKLSDIDKYWELQMNTIRENLLDFRAWSEAEMKIFEYNMEMSGANWGAIMNGLFQMTKAGAENYEKIDAWRTQKAIPTTPSPSPTVSSPTPKSSLPYDRRESDLP
jgi:hypothetical protein